MVINRRKTFRLILLYFISFLLAGCVDKQQPTEISEQVKANPPLSAAKRDLTKELTPLEKNLSEKPETVLKKPRFKQLSPLDTERVSLSFVQEQAAQVLQILAHAAALNLVTSTDFNGNQTITAEYQEMSIREILDSICSMLNVVWYDRSGTIYIDTYTRKILDLDFLGGIRQSNFEVGGDVLGGSSSGEQDSNSGSSPLRGQFSITGETTDSVTDVYTNIEATVDQLLGGDGSFALNRQTGTLLVKTRPARLQDIDAYISILRKKYRRQVLIEAKIIEIGLNKKHELGIDWRKVGGLISSDPLRAFAGSVVTVQPSLSQDQSFYAMNIDSQYSNIAGIFSALEEYGTLSILSNPRLKAMNGQSALISVGQSVSYLRSFQQSAEGTGDNRTTDYTTEIGSVFDGILLGVTPIIESDNIVSLHIIPIKSDLVELDTVEFGSILEPYQITLPRVNLREISTVTRVKSGDIVLLGGLIMEYDDVDESGIPILADLPVFGRLFRLEKTEVKKVELVIALHIKVLES